MKITEDNNNVYIESYVIPKGMEKEDLKARENVIWAMYSRWSAENPEKKCYNNNLQSDIFVVFKSITETTEKAARNYKSTMAFYALDLALQYARKTGQDKPHSKRQAEYDKILIMIATSDLFEPYFSRIKLTVGVKKSGRKNMYCITAIEDSTDEK
ncbi:MAG: hypothetical protein LBI82_03165 [Dysgonamonadaceae bacterium]|jgi:hypothetical protein|nr:hypothetical protein [Dysgonamonadaceae bacterium]